MVPPPVVMMVSPPVVMMPPPVMMVMPPPVVMVVTPPMVMMPPPMMVVVPPPVPMMPMSMPPHDVDVRHAIRRRGEPGAGHRRGGGELRSGKHERRSGQDHQDEFAH